MKFKLLASALLAFSFASCAGKHKAARTWPPAEEVCVTYVTNPPTTECSKPGKEIK